MRLTQAALAECTGVTEQTIRKIEHGEGNPQLDILCVLIKELQIDPDEVFYPSQNTDTPGRKQLELIIADCTDEQLSALLPIIRGALEVINGNKRRAVK